MGPALASPFSGEGYPYAGVCLAVSESVDAFGFKRVDQPADRSRASESSG